MTNMVDRVKYNESYMGGEVDNSHHMLQYGLWSNCNNNCDYCLRMNRIPYSKEEQIRWIHILRDNIKYIDWENKFDYGISILGGEIYYVTDEDIQNEYMLLVDDIIEKILKVSKNPQCKYSTVTNGIYDPAFLFKVIDKIKNEVGMEKVDLNFSYDLKYRFKDENDRKTVLRNINLFHERYNYKVGVQMILTQNVINLWKKGEFDVNKFIEENIPGNNLCFLYPHPVHTGRILNDFFFNRDDFLQFVTYLKNSSPDVYHNFIHSTKNSGTFKATGLRNRIDDEKEGIDVTQQPVMSDGKEIFNEKCGHSVLYQCYSDCDVCMLCDLNLIEGDLDG